jgi:O-antigen/teichoic acid export membrane protein
LLRRDVIASYLGQVWAALIGLAFVPLYVTALGIEHYALIGFFVVMQAWLSVLDLGVTPTLSREMSRLGALPGQQQRMRDVLRTVEWICLGLAVLMAALIGLGAEAIATHWLRPKALDPEIVTAALQSMALVLATRWLEQVYRGGLQGLGDFVWLNVVHAVLATFRWAGGWVLVAFFVPSITAFFCWQALVSIVAVAVYLSRMYRRLPHSERGGSFDAGVVVALRGFAGGMFVGSILILTLSQIDKLLVSALLPLDQFGRYMLAATVAAGLLQLALPMMTAVQPRLTACVARDDTAQLRHLFATACQYMAAFIVPPALLLAIFAEPVLAAWTGDKALSAEVGSLLRPLAIGALCNALMQIPYALQLAHGWTSLSVRINAVAVLAVVPAVVVAVPRFGAAGAAWVWCALNAAYVLIGAMLMFRRLLPEQRWRWYRHAVATPVVAGAAAGLIAAILVPPDLSRLQSVAALALGLLAIAAATACALPIVRGAILLRFR